MLKAVGLGFQDQYIRILLLERDDVARIQVAGI